MEITELVRVLRLVFSAGLGLVLILSVAGLISHELRIVYEKLEGPWGRRLDYLRRGQVPPGSTRKLTAKTAK